MMLEGGWQQQPQPQQEAVKEGLLEKRSDGLLQLWKKKRCVLTEEGLLLIPPKQQQQQQQSQHQDPEPCPSSVRVKELPFSSMKTVDCVERKGKYVYFTVVMAEGKEIDFRGPQEQGWNAEIALRLVRYKNRQAVLAVRSGRQKQQHLLLRQQPQPQQNQNQLQSQPQAQQQQQQGPARLRSASNPA